MNVVYYGIYCLGGYCFSAFFLLANSKAGLDVVFTKPSNYFGISGLATYSSTFFTTGGGATALESSANFFPPTTQPL